MSNLQPGQFNPSMMPKQKPVRQVGDYAKGAEPSEGFTLSKHAARQAAEKGWTRTQVLQAANKPHITYDNGRYPGQKRHIRDDLVAVVHPESKQVLTVYKNVTETDLRPDQTDADAQRYGRNRRS